MAAGQPPSALEVEQARARPPATFAPPAPLRRPRRPCAQYIEENKFLIEAILENQNNGRLKECVHYQQLLQQNLIFLATHADEQRELQPLVFAPQPVPASAAAPSSAAPAAAAPNHPNRAASSR